MSILVHRDTKLVVHGLTGRAGSFHARQCREYGSQVVGGVVPGRGGQTHDDLPVFDSAKEAREIAGANASLVFVPAPFAADAVMEAADAGMEVIICITEGIPVRDMIEVKQFLKDRNTLLVGPNGPGVITPGECKAGIMPGYIHKPGKIGIISRSGTLTYEAVWQVTELGLGQSTCVGLGGDPVRGLGFLECLELFEADPGTEAVILIGEIGGTDEETAAHWIREHMSKPVVAFVAGITAPKGKRMGHAGAIIAGGKGTAAEKIAAFRECGIAVAESPADIGKTLVKALG